MAWCQLTTFCEVQNLLTFRVAQELEPISRQTLPFDCPTELLGEIREPLRAAALEMELRHGESPAAGLVATVLADDAVEPAFDPAGESLYAK